MPKKKGLSAKQRKFAEVYDGNATEAARKAGYTGSDEVLATQGNRLLRNAEVAALIRGRERREVAPHIATREERQRFWSTVLQSEDVDMRDRLRASELLGKSNADFVERVEHSGTLTLESLILQARTGSQAGNQHAPPAERGAAGVGEAPAAARSPDESLPYTPPEVPADGADSRPDVPAEGAERPGTGEGEANP